MTDDNGASAATPRGTKVVVAAAIASAVVTLGVTAMLVSIFEKKQEARNPFFRVVPLDDTTQDPAVWGKNFPSQYDGYKRTVDQVRTASSRLADYAAETL